MLRINKKHLILIVMVSFIFIQKANANVFINEVQISPTEERFLELYNDGSSSVDLTDWYIQRKTASGSTFGSLVSKTNFEGKSINANSYFLISKSGLSNSDVVYDGLTLTESNSIVLKNKGGDIVDKIGWGESSDCSSSCPSNPTTGKSIQKISDGSFIIALPTPKYLNIESNGINNNNESENTDVNNEDSSISSVSATSSTVPVESYKIITKIISPKILTAGIPFTVDHQTTGKRKEKIILGKFVWNFGDGMMKQGVSSDPFSYIYEYPGEYVLNLSFYESTLSSKPDATDKMIIKVIPPGISILSVGTYGDPYIEVENNSSYEMSLNDFILKGRVHSFVIPNGMVILPKSKLKLSPKITGFDFGDLSNITITDSSGQVFATYPKQNIPVYRYSTNNTSQGFVKSEIVEDNKNIDVEEVVNLNNLGANAENSETNVNSKYLIYIGLIAVIVVGIFSIISLRRKDEIPDYVEKEISAKDMTIIE